MFFYDNCYNFLPNLPKGNIGGAKYTPKQSQRIKNKRRFKAKKKVKSKKI